VKTPGVNRERLFRAGQYPAPARFQTAKQASAQLPEVRTREVKGEPPNKRNVEVEEVFFLEE
jgi:hypothetical protein